MDTEHEVICVCADVHKIMSSTTKETLDNQMVKISYPVPRLFLSLATLLLLNGLMNKMAITTGMDISNAGIRSTLVRSLCY